MKKRLVALVICIVMVCSVILTSCSSTNSGSSSTDADPSTTNAETSSSADLDSTYIKSKGTMVVGVTIFEPMDYQENGEWTGFDAELAKDVGEKLGVDVEFTVIDWDNKEMELDSKAVDCIWNGMTLTDEVTSAMECTDPYVINAQVIVMKSDVASDYTDVSQMTDLSFTAESGSAGEDAVTENGLDGNYTAVSAQSDALLEVESGASDACIIDLTMAKAMIGEGTSYSDLQVVQELNYEEYGIGFRKGSDMASIVDEIIDELKDDGTLQELADKYQLTLAD